VPSRRNFLKHAATAIIAAPYIMRSSRGAIVTAVGRPRVRTSLREALEGSEVGSTHEHTLPEEQRLRLELDVFSMFQGYANRDLSAPVFGKWPLHRISDRRLPLPERWKLFEPHWQQARWWRSGNLTRPAYFPRRPPLLHAQFPALPKSRLISVPHLHKRR
jgi:hypothetical protein